MEKKSLDNLFNTELLVIRIRENQFHQMILSYYTSINLIYSIDSTFFMCVKIQLFWKMFSACHLVEKDYLSLIPLVTELLKISDLSQIFF